MEMTMVHVVTIWNAHTLAFLGELGELEHAQLPEPVRHLEIVLFVITLPLR